MPNSIGNALTYLLLLVCKIYDFYTLQIGILIWLILRNGLFHYIIQALTEFKTHFLYTI